MKIKVNKDGFVKLSQFKKFVDVSKVKYYTIEETYDCESESPAALIMFYDKNKKVIKPNAIS